MVSQIKLQKFKLRFNLKIIIDIWHDIVYSEDVSTSCFHAISSLDISPWWQYGVLKRLISFIFAFSLNAEGVALLCLNQNSRGIV